MLVVAWDAMDAAIPSLEARENLTAFSIAMVSSPYIEQDTRESILSGWRDLIEKGVKFLAQPMLQKTSQSGESKLDPKGLDRPLRDVIHRIRSAFGREIWE